MTDKWENALKDAYNYATDVHPVICDYHDVRDYFEEVINRLRTRFDLMEKENCHESDEKPRNDKDSP